jgi:hypothetical protein
MVTSSSGRGRLDRRDNNGTTPRTLWTGDQAQRFQLRHLHVSGTRGGRQAVGLPANRIPNRATSRGSRLISVGRGQMPTTTQAQVATIKQRPRFVINCGEARLCGCLGSLFVLVVRHFADIRCAENHQQDTFLIADIAEAFHQAGGKRNRV